MNILYKIYRWFRPILKLAMADNYVTMGGVRKLPESGLFEGVNTIDPISFDNPPDSFEIKPIEK